jgi:sugar phosphate isomerase/epimerase
MIAVCTGLHKAGHPQVGIVYNFHHGHAHMQDFAEVMKLLKPYLLCLNLNGMNEDAKPKILPIGKGQHEKAMIKAVIESGYKGPIGILGHIITEDVRVSLENNLNGLERLLVEIRDE